MLSNGLQNFSTKKNDHIFKVDWERFRWHKSTFRSAQKSKIRQLLFTDTETSEKLFKN